MQMQSYPNDTGVQTGSVWYPHEVVRTPPPEQKPARRSSARLAQDTWSSSESSGLVRGRQSASHIAPSSSSCSATDRTRGFVLGGGMPAPAAALAFGRRWLFWPTTTSAIILPPAAPTPAPAPAPAWLAAGCAGRGGPGLEPVPELEVAVSVRPTSATPPSYALRPTRPLPGCVYAQPPALRRTADAGSDPR